MKTKSGADEPNTHSLSSMGNPVIHTEHVTIAYPENGSITYVRGGVSTT